MDFEKIFSESFDTFKVFSNISAAKASLTTVNTPKSVWQILNHLIIWQEFQLKRLRGIKTSNISEIDTWNEDAEITDEEVLSKKIKVFQDQIHQIKAEITRLNLTSENLEKRLKIIQDLSLHLSFHLGEMILLMRQNGHYPMPAAMKDFLEEV